MLVLEALFPPESEKTLTRLEIESVLVLQVSERLSLLWRYYSMSWNL